MNKNLLIIGAGIYSVVAREVAESMNFFDKIDFIDDEAMSTPDGKAVIGKISDIEALSVDYGYAFVAIGNPETRLELLNKIEEETHLKVWSLVSPRAYVSSSAQIYKGSIIEPIAVINSGCIVSTGCIVSAGAVVNHASMLCDGVHVDCNATVGGHTLVPAGTKIRIGEYYSREKVETNDLFFDPKRWQESLAKNKETN
ncbi:MAG: hypothetical protein PHN55_14940 [Dysgonamonadaceae bacterium]|nr:hypothetical protein [Dysgonamonadaceae bacterium]